MSETELTALIAEIVTAYRERCFWMKCRMQLDNQLLAYLRIQMGWEKASPAERKRMKQAAVDVVALGEQYRRDVVKAKKSTGNEDHRSSGDIALAYRVPLPAELVPYAGVVLDGLACRDFPAIREAEATKRLAALTRRLPVWALVKPWRGFAEGSLATIVGEAGRSLDQFPDRGRLLKWLSIGVIDGIRQGNLPRSASAEEWQRHGYSPQRRSRITTISSSMLRTSNPRYRALYDARKAYEIARAEAAGLIIAPADKIPKSHPERYRSLKHIELRARRYAEQHIVIDVWRAWHQAHKSVEADHASDGQ